MRKIDTRLTTFAIQLLPFFCVCYCLFVNAYTDKMVIEVGSVSVCFFFSLCV